MAVDIRREADELVRYYAELGRRLGQNGVRDVPELLALCDRVWRALDAVSQQELVWVAEQAQRLIEELVRMDGALTCLRQMKLELSVIPPGAAVATGSGRPR
jgi:hypothetical protein